MNTNSQKRTHRTPIYRRPAVILTFVGILVVVAAAVIIILNLTGPTEDNNTDSSSSSNTSSTTDNSTSASDNTSSDDGWEPKVSMYEGENANASHELTGTIIRKEANPDMKTLTVYAMIDQYFNSPGTCTLLLKQSGNVVYRTEVTAEADITTSVCDPIEISTAQITPGTYEIEIQLSGNDKTGIIKEEVEL